VVRKQHWLDIMTYDFLKYIAGVYRENVSNGVVYGENTLGWIYHEAHWSNWVLWNNTAATTRRPWFEIDHIYIYSGFPGSPFRTAKEFDTYDVVAFSPRHLLIGYNPYGFMVGRGQPTCGSIIDLKETGRLEVLRMGGHMAKIEYGASGCWYYAMKGSGVFLELGRSLVAYGRTHLAQRLRLHEHNASSLHVNTRWHNNWTWVDVQNEINRTTAWQLENRIDICRFAAPLGYDTVQIADETCYSDRYGGRVKASNEMASVEIISCYPGCMHMRTRHTFRESPCIPAEPLFTGFDGTRPCLCDDNYPLLNCHNTPCDTPPFRLQTSQGRFIVRSVLNRTS
jgi:hypothetical protein